MVIESIREFNRAVPFVPYEFWTVSGQHFEVPHPDFIFVSPRGSFVVLVDNKERPHHISGILIERGALLPAKARKSTKRSGD